MAHKLSHQRVLRKLAHTEIIPGTGGLTPEKLCRTRALPKGTVWAPGMICTTNGAHQHKHLVLSVTDMGVHPRPYGSGIGRLYLVSLRYLGQFYADNRFRISRSQRPSEREFFVGDELSPPAGHLGNLRLAEPIGHLKPVCVGTPPHDYVLRSGHDFSAVAYGPSVNLRPPVARQHPDQGSPFFYKSRHTPDGLLSGWSWQSLRYGTQQELTHYYECGGRMVTQAGTVIALSDAISMMYFQQNLIDSPPSVTSWSAPVPALAPEAVLSKFRLKANAASELTQEDEDEITLQIDLADEIDDSPTQSDLERAEVERTIASYMGVSLDQARVILAQAEQAQCKGEV